MLLNVLELLYWSLELSSMTAFAMTMEAHLADPNDGLVRHGSWRRKSEIVTTEVVPLYLSGRLGCNQKRSQMPKQWAFVGTLVGMADSQKQLVLARQLVCRGANGPV